MPGSGCCNTPVLMMSPRRPTRLGLLRHAGAGDESKEAHGRGLHFALLVG